MLEGRGYLVHHLWFGEPLPDGQYVIALLDDEAPFFENMDNHRFNTIRNLIESLNGCGILWVTGLSQAKCQDPRFAQINSIARTIRNEMLATLLLVRLTNLKSLWRNSSTYMRSSKPARRTKPSSLNSNTLLLTILSKLGGTIHSH